MQKMEPTHEMELIDDVPPLSTKVGAPHPEADAMAGEVHNGTTAVDERTIDSPKKIARHLLF